MKNYNEKFYNISAEERNSILDEYLTYTYTGDNKNLKVIISHSDLDGVTSALNLVEACKMFGDSDIVVFLERTSRKEFTSKIMDTFLEENIKEMDIYDNIEFMISDRMFIDLDAPKKYSINMYKFFNEKVSLSWYDHHAGNVVAEEDIRIEYGDILKDYNIKTDMFHCGATLTCESMMDRIKEEVDEFHSIVYKEKLFQWSKNVNLWDTFQWKNNPDLLPAQRSIGKKMGTVDKMVDNDKDLFKFLMARLYDYGDLDNKDIYDWVDGLASDYEALVKEEYKKAYDNCIIYTNEITILPAEWKFASAVKEMYADNHPDNKLVITCHKSGGTVYSAIDYEIPSYDIAKFIGTRYGLNGGGHKHAAGFACLDIRTADYLSDEEREFIVRDRITDALNAFFNILCS